MLIYILLNVWLIAFYFWENIFFILKLNVLFTENKKSQDGTATDTEKTKPGV
jgi:hypothetical protein